MVLQWFYIFKYFVSKIVQNQFCIPFLEFIKDNFPQRGYHFWCFGVMFDFSTIFLFFDIFGDL